MKKTIILAFAALSILCSCVHQFPEAKPADVILTLKFDTDLSYYKTLMFPDETKSPVAQSSDYSHLLGQDFTDHAAKSCSSSIRS